MGARASKTAQELLTKYESETFLTKEEITNAYRIFSSFFQDGIIPSVDHSRVSMPDLMEKLPFLKYDPFRDRISAVFSTYLDTPTPESQTGSLAVTYSNLATNGRMNVSPSGQQQLSTTGGSWRFDDFIHFLSAFNEKAPVGLKHEVAFCIYDSDGDGYIGEQDLLSVIQRLVGHNNLDSNHSVEVSQNPEAGTRYDAYSAETLKDEEYRQIVEQVFHEADLDRDRKMALKEFTNTMSKFPDFTRHFCVPSLENYV